MCPDTPSPITPGRELALLRLLLDAQQKLLVARVALYDATQTMRPIESTSKQKSTAAALRQTVLKWEEYVAQLALLLHKKQFRVLQLRLALRATPNIISAKIGEVSRGDLCIILGQSGEWYHVRAASGKRGFIHRVEALPVSPITLSSKRGGSIGAPDSTEIDVAGRG